MIAKILPLSLSLTVLVGLAPPLEMMLVEGAVLCNSFLESQRELELARCERNDVACAEGVHRRLDPILAATREYIDSLTPEFRTQWYPRTEMFPHARTRARQFVQCGGRPNCPSADDLRRCAGQSNCDPPSELRRVADSCRNMEWRRYEQGIDRGAFRRRT